jgi:large subunit ribosomal protein L21e
MPHPKFKGHTGRIASIRGAAYEVHLTDGGKLKSIFVKPEHLKK